MASCVHFVYAKDVISADCEDRPLVSSFEAEEGVNPDHLRDFGDGHARSYKDLYCYDEGFEFQESL